MELLEFTQGQQMSLYEETIRDWLDNRTLIINEQIDDDVIESFILFILKWNREDRHVPVDERTPIKIYVNCPGGDLVVAMNLCDAIMNSKTPITGVGFGLVASAAFHIFISCHKRLAFQNTVFLMHDGSVSVSSSGSKAKDTMKFYDRIDERVKAHVISHTEMSEEFYDDHYDQELYLYADEAKELGVIDEIVGVDDTDIDDIY